MFPLEMLHPLMFIFPRLQSSIYLSQRFFHLYHRLPAPQLALSLVILAQVVKARQHRSHLDHLDLGWTEKDRLSLNRSRLRRERFNGRCPKQTLNQSLKEYIQLLQLGTLET